MKHIELLQGRISTALDEIASGLEQLSNANDVAVETAEDAIDPEMFAAVQEQLNAALEAAETADQARTKAESQLSETEAALESAQAELSAFQADMAAAAQGMEDNAVAPELLSEMQSVLDAEKETNTQLQDDIAVLNERVFALEAELSAAKGETEQDAEPPVEVAVQTTAPSTQDLSGPLTELDGRIFQLQTAHDALLENNVALRNAAEAGIADADAINTALQAELDAVNAARAVDQAEARAVYVALEGMLGPDAIESTAQLDASEGEAE